MNKNVLVAYASKPDSTGYVAQSIRDTLTQAGVQVTVDSVGNEKNFKTYDPKSMYKKVIMGVAEEIKPVSVSFFRGI